MDVEYVFSRDLKVLSSIKDQGYDLESLCFMCKDLIGIFRDLELQNQEICDFIMNLKCVHDSSNGKSAQEDEGDIPVRITVANTNTLKVYYFTLFSSDSDNVLYSCGICLVSLERSQLKKHVMDHENNYLAN
jgi:hypothetical protein